VDPLHRDPPREALDWVAASVGPGAEVAAVRRLTEGRWHANHVVTVRHADGAERELVLRRWARPGWRSEDPDFTPAREATALDLLGSASVPTPRLVALDPDGTSCDVPALLTDRLPGQPPDPEDVDSFVRQLAEALPEVHGVDGGAHERVPAYERYYAPTDPRLDSAVPPAWARRPELWQRALALASRPPPPGPARFIHRDYHPGNTLWDRGRLTGVVDWTQASVGPVAIDTAHMRWNLAVGHGLEAAEGFLRHHRALAGEAAGQTYWDVVTLLDVIPELARDEVPPTWDLDRLERYLELVLDA
jgi:aminoglycoside phosphotransferase (APT) family kinase protein